MITEVFRFKQSDRKWHLPVLAGVCMGLPLMTGYFTGYVNEGRMASMAGFVILYINSREPLTKQIVTVMSCSIGLMISFTVGILFSFNPWVAAIVLAVHAFTIHIALFYLGLRRPPGNFFFILVVSLAICMPFDSSLILHRVGAFALGTVTACILAIIYASVTTIKRETTFEKILNPQNPYGAFLDAIVFGVFVGAGLLISHWLALDNPYWVPSSCAAVMLGVSTRHVWARSIQRIAGTLVGLGLVWIVLLLKPSALSVYLAIIALQIVVEMLVVRNYAIAVVFITVLTILLADWGHATSATQLAATRFIDIVIDSLLGGVGGWVLYNERLYYRATLYLRHARIRVQGANSKRKSKRK